MASVYIAHVWPKQFEKVTKVAEHHFRYFSAFASKTKKHELVDDPAHAEIILAYAGYKQFFANGKDVNLLCLRNSRIWQRYKHKCVLYNAEDKPFPFCKAILPCVERRWHDPCLTSSGPYLNYVPYSWLEYSAYPGNFKHLFSFRGSLNSHPVRQRLAALHHKDTPIIDTFGTKWGAPEFKDRYVEEIHNSLFALCPRGYAPASSRLFEVMKLGRVPVILADEWVPPKGPDWDKFSITVKESDYQDIPRILHRHMEAGPEMARRARAEWLKFFGPDAVFDTLISYGLDLLDCDRRPGLRAIYNKAVLRARVPHRKRLIKEILRMEH